MTIDIDHENIKLILRTVQEIYMKLSVLNECYSNLKNRIIDLEEKVELINPTIL